MCVLACVRAVPNHRQGTCGICDVKVDGVDTPACTAKMPKRDVTIEYRASAAAQERMKERMQEQRAAKKAAKAGAAAPAASGSVKPTNNNPFGGGNPFAGFGAPAPPPPEEPTGPSISELEERLKAENAAKKKGGWPFG